jgi:hypothetical protein
MATGPTHLGRWPRTRGLPAKGGSAELELNVTTGITPITPAAHGRGPRTPGAFALQWPASPPPHRITLMQRPPRRDELNSNGPMAGERRPPVLPSRRELPGAVNGLSFPSDGAVDATAYSTKSNSRSDTTSFSSAMERSL